MRKSGDLYSIIFKILQTWVISSFKIFFVQVKVGFYNLWKFILKESLVEGALAGRLALISFTLNLFNNNPHTHRDVL